MSAKKGRKKKIPYQLMVLEEIKLLDKTSYHVCF